MPVLSPAARLHAEEPGIAPPPGAALPLGLPVRDAAGQPLTLGDAIGSLPVIFAFADYDCTTLCGTALGLAAAALPGTGLRPGQDYRLVVLGLDAADGPDKARAMRQAWLGDSGALARTAAFLTAGEPALATAMQALGYAATRRGDGFDHPLALFVLQGDGRLSAILPALGAEPEDLRAALRAAGRAAEPGLFAQVRLLCASAASGHGAVLRGVLAIGGVATIGLLAGSFVLLRRRERGA
ncbi:MAG: SCO family protein [Acetobacteraceae bacterium]|nr:MAG: SCO family protein [Acetobacteraceae bacterium]